MLRFALASGRALLKARGPDAEPLLHSLVTNDINHLKSQSLNFANCLYTMFLNARGRVLFDTIIYSDPEMKTLLIDCDKTLLPSLQKHISMYKLKKNVSIEISDDNVWLLFDSSLSHDSNSTETHSLVESTKKYSRAYIDPRLNLLGARLLFPKSMSSSQIIDHLNLSSLCSSEDAYRNFRYKLGVSESSQEIPIFNSFPLEVNCDYMHGVSFHKGCYIGQELTARTHHTGVVRKRMMPLRFDQEVSIEIPIDTPIYGSNSDKAIGKVRGVCGNVGIGLLRISEALVAPTLKILNYNATTFRPNWWPVEVSKEKPN